jgi:NADPH:quinone reductase-like Zn-dependent oxidoreductase
VNADEKDLQFLVDACDSGALVPHIEQTFPLEEIAQAHALSETEKVRGKIAIRIV